jgi:rubrerythrin
MSSHKTKALNKFLIDEKESVTKYTKAIKKTKGVEKETYKEILPDEKKHLHELKEIKNKKNV